MTRPLTRAELEQRRAKPLASDVGALDTQAINTQLAVLADWKYVEGALERSFTFENYYETIAFVNAMAWMIHHEDHHPNLEVSYNRCVVRFDTHTVQGVSENDFICAAKCDALYAIHSAGPV